MTIRKGSTTVITRNKVAVQSVTIKNWKDTIHNIVLGGTSGQLGSYLAKSKPINALKNTAQNEVWKKGGLLA